MSDLLQKRDEGAQIQEKEQATNPYVVEVRFQHNDPLDPRSWSSRKKWRVLFVALFITFTSTYNSTANGAVASAVEKRFNISSDVFLVSSFAYQLMLGVGPLLLAPLSESFGRRPLLVVLTFLITLLFLPQALAPNFASICATRFVQGAMGSVEGPVISGVVADLFPKISRGRAMATFVLAVYAGNACGPSISAAIATKVDWQWCYWLQMIMSGVSCILVFFFLPETRGEVILSKRAAHLTKETGKEHYITGARRIHSVFEAVKISSSRPLLFLFTEPIVALCALWIGTAWGVVFLYNGSVGIIFSEVYGFPSETRSAPLLTGLVGALIGWVWNETVQAYLYRRAVKQGGGRATPEARLYSSVLGAFFFAVGSFGLAGVARASVPWIASCIFLTLSQAGLYAVYLATYLYLADVYESYASSANAAQSLLRGIAGACFPWFTARLYHAIGIQWASVLVGFVSLAFTAVPVLIIKYGASFRARSRVATELSHQEGEILNDETEIVA